MVTSYDKDLKVHCIEAKEHFTCVWEWNHENEGEDKIDAKWGHHLSFCLPVSSSDRLNGVVVAHVPVLEGEWKVDDLEEMSKLEEVIFFGSKTVWCLHFHNEERDYLKQGQTKEGQEYCLKGESGVDV